MSNQQFIDWLLTLMHQSRVSKQIVRFHLVSSVSRSFYHAHFHLKLITPTVENKRSDFETCTWTWTRTPLLNSNFWKLALNCICSKSLNPKFAFSQAWQGRLRPTVLWSWGNLLVNHDGRSCEWRSQKYAKITCPETISLLLRLLYMPGLYDICPNCVHAHQTAM